MLKSEPENTRQIGSLGMCRVSSVWISQQKQKWFTPHNVLVKVLITICVLTQYNPYNNWIQSLKFMIPSQNSYHNHIYISCSYSLQHMPIRVVNNTPWISILTFLQSIYILTLSMIKETLSLLSYPNLKGLKFFWNIQGKASSYEIQKWI